MHTKHLLVAAAALGAATAAADVTVRTVSEKDGTPVDAIYIQYGKVRLDSLQGEASYVLWERGKPQYIVVSPAKKTYMVIDQAEVQARIKQMNDTMKQIPEAFRAQVMGSMPKVEMKYTKGGKATKGGRACSMVDIKVTGVPQVPGQPPKEYGSELCVVAESTLGIPGADLETLRQMALFSAEMVKGLGQVFAGPPDMSAVGGWPVWSRDKSTGIASVLKDVDKSKIDGALFTVPAGYTQQQMPSMDDPMGKGDKKKKKKKKD